jgi:uncharacterized protein YndB with AHSA1/START domain
MAKAQQSSPETTLQMRRTFAAPRQKVFRAWTDAAQLARWFAPSTEYSTVVPELDLRVGGKYRLEIRHKDGNVHCVMGTYQEIKPPEKIVFTWRWDGDARPEDSLVTIEFQDLGNSTEVILTHERLPNLEERDKHAHGWTGCLDQLAKFLSV